MRIHLLPHRLTVFLVMWPIVGVLFFLHMANKGCDAGPLTQDAVNIISHLSSRKFLSSVVVVVACLMMVLQSTIIRDTIGKVVKHSVG